MAKDADFDKVSLLLHCDGVNGSKTIIDSSQHAHAVTAVGGASIATAQSKFGGAAVAFDGATGYLSVPPSEGFNFGTGDFTLEFFMWYAGSSNSFPAVIANGASSWSAGAVSLAVDHAWAPNKVIFSVNSHSTGVPVVAGATSIYPYDVWHHVAVARSGTSIKLFLNGLLDGSATVSAGLAIDFSLGTGLKIGGGWDGVAGMFTGYLDEIRITKGLARYTEAFTPPTAAHLMAGSFSGTVMSASGAPAARLVRAMREDTGAFGGSTTSDAGTGAYSIAATANTPHTLIAYPGTGEDLPALLLRGVVPV